MKAPALTIGPCAAEGAGFFLIPGTETCLRVGGYAWVEGYINGYTDYSTYESKTYSIATGGFIFDARTNTDLGTLRSYAEARLRWRTADAFGEPTNAAEAELRKAFVQFAGFTAGYAQSFFDFYANAHVFGTDPHTIGDDTRINLIAYTAEFARGLSATVSFEDANDRLAGVKLSDPSLPNQLSSNASYQAGPHAPDIVGTIKLAGAWGSAQLSGALHQTRTLEYLNPSLAEGKWGYALQAGLMLNLPALGEGDTLYVQTAYTSGATSYLGLQDPSGRYSVPDAFLSGFGRVTLVTGWNATASLLHNWSATWSSALFGGYAAYDFNDQSAQFFYGATGGINYNVGGNLAFTPVKSFTIALQCDYTVNAASDYVSTNYSPSLATTKAGRALLFMSRAF